jgi:uncharacterized RDD family membrane protein YckC
MIEHKYNTFWPRVGAGIVDGFVFLPLSLLDKWIWSISQSIPIIFLLTWFIIWSFSYVTYSVLMHGFFGQTLGKMAAKVKVLDISENKLTMRQAFLRDIVPIVLGVITIFYVVPIVLERVHPFKEITWTFPMIILLYANLCWYFAEVITMLANKKRRAVHDFIARSVVVRYGPRRTPIHEKENTLEKLKDLTVLALVTILVIALVVLGTWFYITYIQK